MDEQENSRWEILLVDDDEDDYILIQKMLHEDMKHPFSLHWTKEGAKFIELAANNKYDLCLVEYRLGNETGLELIARLLASNPEIPVILITGWENFELINTARGFGVSSFLHKSTLNSKSLCRTIQKVIEDSKKSKS
jgi:two-component system, cell cycle sensor histidine kinase and response regulator CckA